MVVKALVVGGTAVVSTGIEQQLLVRVSVFLDATQEASANMADAN
jgi:hypothetical protein